MNTDHEDTESLLAYLRGELEPGDVVALERQLLEEGELRKALLELSVEESVLIDWAKSERIVTLLDDETFREAAHPAETKKEAVRYADGRLASGWWAAAAILAISVMGYFMVSRPDAGKAAPRVAHLVASVDATWQGVTPELNTPMATGPYRLESGSIDLLFADGAKVSVSGPAQFDLKSTRHLHLESGNLVAQIPDEALGFIVTSPQSEVVDLGTEFGLSVSNAGLTDVHVLDGLVEVLPADAAVSATPGKGVMIAEGHARRFRGEPDKSPEKIPVSSRAGLIGNERVNELGLRMLRGSVRVVERIDWIDLSKFTGERNWIDLVAEQKGVILNERARSVDRRAGQLSKLRESWRDGFRGRGAQQLPAPFSTHFHQSRERRHSV